MSIKLREVEKPRAVLLWSGGKDSAMALISVQKTYEIVALVTTVSSEFKRISMHGVREELLREQANALGISLEIVYVTNPSTNEQYEAALSNTLKKYRNDGITDVICGDIFLEDLRAWRESQLETIAMRGVFPLWRKNTKSLINEFIALRFRSIVCCVSDAFLGEDSVGAAIDHEFVSALPKEVDPCGENGEFHSFVYDGPIFNHPLSVKVGENVYRPITGPRDSCGLSDSDSERKIAQGFWFCELTLNSVF